MPAKSSLFLLYFLFFVSMSSAAQVVTIAPGTYVTGDGPLQLVISNGGVVNNGNFSVPNSTVSITGNAATANSIIGGTGTTSFHHLIINKSANDVQLGGNISVAGTLTMQARNVLLNNFTLDLGNSGTISGENPASYITGLSGGSITRIAVLNAPSAVNPGNIGIAISSAANPGSTTITRRHVAQLISAGQPSINRYFIIAPAMNTGLNATLDFSYFDTELNGITETNLFYWQSDNGGATWNYRSRTSTNTATNIVTRNGFNSLSMVTLSNNPLALPIGYFRLTARLAGSDALLTWVTINEYNNDHFEIERSADGINFSTIGTKPSQGNSTGTQTYTAIDPFPFNPLTYYRIRQVDIDGSAAYSNIAPVNMRNAYPDFLRIFPNPAEKDLNIHFSSATAKKMMLSLYDAGGKLVEQKAINCNAGINTITWSVHHLAAGSYYLVMPGLSDAPVKLLKL